MRILMVASEAHPFAKTGGLADVVGALPRALARLGHHVDVVIPRYRGIAWGTPLGRLDVRMGRQAIESQFYTETIDNVRTIFVEHRGYYDRPFLYGTANQDYPDNPERFAFLAAAAAELAASAALNWGTSAAITHQPPITTRFYDIIHTHDWQAAMVPLFLRDRAQRRSELAEAATVFTIHNLAYQGVFEASWLSRLGLSADLLHVNALEYWGRISYLKAGIVFSRLITTVSPRYAEEIQTPEFGFGFDGILRARRADLVGILNGIDYDQWDPARDPNLPEPYFASKPDAKLAAKRWLLERYGFTADEERLVRPLIGLVSRMVDQKGFDLIAAAATELPNVDATFVLLGTGEQRYEELWLNLATRYPDRIGARIGFDERLAHLIEGGADMFLMPSRFEPCGLNQMYSLRYGTVPVVRATGGLFDTVRDFNAATGEGTGFTFQEYSPGALIGTLRRAIGVYQNRVVWRRIQVAGMTEDHSWDRSAGEYVKVYERAMNAQA